MFIYLLSFIIYSHLAIYGSIPFLPHPPPPPPVFFHDPQLQKKIGCYIARYYVRKKHVHLGVIEKFMLTKLGDETEYIPIYYASFCFAVEFELGFLPNALLKVSYICLFVTPP